MFEERLREISERIDKHSKNKADYLILTHKKHRREIFFKDNRKAFKFIKIKFGSSFKRLAYFLVKTGVIKPFLKKIKLSGKLGDVIFVAGQIKCFNLEKGIVTSFTKNEEENKFFIESKKFQKKIGKEGFAPIIYEVNEKLPYSREEFLGEYVGGRDVEIFKKLHSYYKRKGIRRIPVKKYISLLNRLIKKTSLDNPFINGVLSKVSKNKGRLLMTEIHGDFAKEQVLIKNDDYVYTDWNPKKGLIIEDLINFFQYEEDLLGNQKFMRILEIYPLEVRKNINMHIILNEISSLIKRKGRHYPFSKRRIQNLINGLN